MNEDLKPRVLRRVLFSTVLLSAVSVASGQTNCTVVESYSNVVFGPQGSATYTPTVGGPLGPYLLPAGVYAGCPAPTYTIAQPSDFPNLISLGDPQQVTHNGGFDNYWFQLNVAPNPYPSEQIGKITFTSGSGSSVTTAGDFANPSPGILLSTSKLQFSPQPMNTTSHRQVIVLTNNSTATVTISQISATNGFSIGAASTCQDGPISAEAICNIYVSFTPTQAGSTTGTLTVTDDASNNPPPVALSGTTGCNANSPAQPFGQYDAPAFDPLSAEWTPQEQYPNSDGSPVPQYFGFLPEPNPIDSPYALVPTIKSGCALTSAATMLSSFSSLSNLNITPALLDTMLKGPLLGYGTGKVNLCPLAAPNCTAAQRVPYGDMGEFLWGSLPLAVNQSINYLGSQELITGTLPQPTAWDDDKFHEGEEGTVYLDQYLADYICGDTDLFSTPPSGRTFSPPATVILQLKHTTSTGQHFVTVTGWTTDVSGTGTDWTVFDPAWLNAPDTLSGHLNGFQNQAGAREQFTVIGTRAYQGAGGGAGLGGTANSPIELLVTDPMGRQLGQLNGTDVFGVPYASYTRDFLYNDDDSGGLANGDPTGIKEFNIPSPPEGTYEVVATGTGSGTYTLTFTAVASDGTAQQSIETGMASPGVAVTYQVTYSTTPGAPFTVTATAPEVSFSPMSVSAFAEQLVGTESSAQAITLSNTGNASLNISSILASGDFSQSNTCGQGVAAGSNCTISVIFAPTASGTRAGALTIKDSASGSPQTLTLSGMGISIVTPTVTVTPSASSITTAQPLSVTVAVSGGNGNPTPTGRVTLTSSSYTSAAATLSGDSASINIPAGSLVTGSDTLTASYSGDSNYNASTGATLVTVTNAVNPGITINGTAISVTPGATTGNTSTVTVTPAGGFTGSVVLTAAVTSSPAGTQYSPTLGFGSTNLLSITGTTAGTATLTIYTTAASSATLIYPRRPEFPRYSAGVATLACILIFAIPARRRTLLTMLRMLMFLVALTGGMLACGGGGGGDGGASNPGTTAGIYIVTVTGTSGTTSVNGNVTLTVQ